MRLVVGVTGASGAIFGIRTLQVLKTLGVETHLVISKWARTTIAHETTYSIGDVEALATEVHHPDNQAASLSSGSFRTDGMIVAPCSMKTVAAIRAGFGDSLISRAADVTLKERRKLVLMVRESPLSEIHLDNMLALARMGTVILPPMPAFYSNPKSLDEMVDHIVGRVLDQFSLNMPGMKRWDGFEGNATQTR
jgi:4-hydroxy-3-polyprenylbenzoate decarboxylase